ncbi:helix-turn-helix transcriptional regulator [Microbacterium sp. K41]|uniref:helix-turn-helix transcriptional regulator n=1 Tax=Microbacterium sp. K41 TaxID=2305437 RepID=UPI00109C8969|nr:helix-turn-helix domain-containing protein [Microbacterium sp. K41]
MSEATTCDTVLDIKQVAERTGLAVKTLYNLRGRGEGPKSFALRGRVRYFEADVNAWIADAASAA